jgi:myo-inositol-1(or 4)-monophosphatase
VVMSPAWPGPDELAELERVAVAAARSAGRLILQDRPSRVEVASTKSSPTDVVTAMDQRSQDHLLAFLGQARPTDGILGEEEGGVSGTSGITWVIDPIDGTVNYLYGIPAYAVSVAAVFGDPGGADWLPVAGAVCNPMSGELYRARTGGGAWLETSTGTTRLTVSDCDMLASALVATGFGYAPQRRGEQARGLLELLPKVRDIRREGSAALDLCHVASGRIDAYYESGLNAWDFAAGWLVASEAGASIGGPGPDSAPSGVLLWACGPGLTTAFPGLVRDLTATHIRS